MISNSRMPALLSLLLVFTLLLSACKPAAAPTPAATLTPTASLTPSPIPTATLIPAATASPQPTPLPAGYHTLDWAGLSFVTPESWESVDQTTGTLILRDAKENNFFMLVFAQVKDEAMTMDEVIDKVITALGADKSAVTSHTDLMDVTVKGAESAQMTEINYDKGINGHLFRTYVLNSATRRILIIFTGPQDAFERKQLTLERIFKSLALTGPRPYGLDRSETVYQLASEPEPSSLDPAVSTSSSEDYVGLLFSGLVRLSPDLQIVPDLAEDWEISPDGATYTFTLREGLKFSDGTSLTAQDVVDSWERAANPELDSTTARTYLGDIQGVQAVLDGESDAISGLAVLDERTLQVTLVGPRPYFLAKLTYPTCMVVDVRHASMTDEKWVWTANASGPFQIREHIEDEALIFERNPNYPRPAGVKYLLYSFSWGGSPKSLFEDGEVDLLPISSADVVQVQKEDDPSYNQLASVPSMCTTLLQFNTTSQPVDDPRVREALALAIDRDELNDVIFSGLSLPAGAILPPAMPGYSADLDKTRFDVVAAKQALQDSSYAGKAVTLQVSVAGYAGDESPLVSALVEMWKQNLGVNVQVENVDPEDFTRAVRENPGDVVFYGWCADYPDPENYLDLLYHTGSDFNVAAYSNPALDNLLEKARSEVDSQQRLALYHQVEKTLLEEYVSLPLFHGLQYRLINPRLENYAMTPLGVQQMQNVTLKP